MKKQTEAPSKYRNLENMEVLELLSSINREDQAVPLAVEKVIPSIAALVDAIVERMQDGGRLFYIGAGTSGRLGVLDASEVPPTYGVPTNWIIGLIAGGDTALRNAVEDVEDSVYLAWENLQEHHINTRDVVVGIAASGTTPYVVHGLKTCREKGIATGCIACNYDSEMAQHADYPIEVVVGPEFVTGSTRMKSGTAQKLVLNMISTSVMIKMGRVQDNKMVDMQLSNAKLLDRGTKMVMHSLPGIGYEEAQDLLLKNGSVRQAIEAGQGASANHPRS